MKDFTKEELDWLEDQLLLLEYVRADRRLPIDQILKQPEHVHGYQPISLN